MELKQLAPWNWFRKEQESEGHRLPMLRHRRCEHYPDTPGRYGDLLDPFLDSLARFPYTRSLFPDLWRGVESGTWFKPLVDISAADTAYTISTELPGVAENQVSIEVVGDTLTIRGEKEHEQEEKGKNFYCVERSYGSFQRQLSLPEDADAEGIQATFKKGVLKVTVPRKTAATPTARRIEVKSD